MNELEIGPELVGREVCNAARPEWGVGKVLEVIPTQVGGSPAFRLSIQFATGHRRLVAPPARLIEPPPEFERTQGWIDKLGKRTADDRLRKLPTSATEIVGTPLQRIAALLPLYAYEDQPASLIEWARRQLDIADPLTHWTRDELSSAFHDFCTERDAYLRMLVATLRQKEGPEATREAFAELPQPLQEAIQTALAKPL